MSDARARLERALWSLRAYDAMALATSDSDGPYVGGVFFAPELADGGIRLVIATLPDTRLQAQMRANPRVAFMCSPGSAARWIQGSGLVALVDDAARHADLQQRLVAHAPGARDYVERFATVPAIITVRRLKIVEAIDREPVVLEL